MRLFSVWGAIDKVHNTRIMSHLSGSTVLDLGCGYGELSDFLRQNNFKVVGVDADYPSLEAGRNIFPAVDIRHGGARHLDFPDGYFNNIILKNVLHHLYAEEARDLIFQEILRVLSPGGNLVMFDPNPHLILKLCRKIVRHDDVECTPKEIKMYLQKFQMEIRDLSYYEILGIPLSGGFVGPQLFWNIKPLVYCLVKVNDGLSRFIARIGLGPFILWRYCLHAVKL